MRLDNELGPALELGGYENSWEWRIYKARQRIAGPLTDWMRHIPVVGPAVRNFWYCVITETESISGVLDAMSFSYMNDFMFDRIGKPTVWHTWYSMTHDNQAPYSGLYKFDPPPSSLAEAIALEQKYETEEWKQAMKERYAS